MSKISFKKNSAPNSDKKLPIPGASFSVDILELQPSRMNPRKNRNGKDYQEHYESLKHSIKNIGLQSTLTVTKYPDSEQFEMFNGGNTRLLVLTELYNEYKADGEDDKATEIRYQQVIYQAYTDDLDILVKHMAENEERINMTFIDKARAVFQIRELYLKQYDESEISNNKLVKYIHNLGWTSVNQRAMTELTFAFEKLSDAIPLVLDSGMGRPKIQQLRLWLGYTKKYIDWLIKNYNYDYSYEQAEQLFLDTLTDYNDDIEPFNLETFWNDYIFRLSTELMVFDKKLNIDHVAFELMNVEELGRVLDNVDPTELSKQLKDTSTVPHFEFPEPRKPRTTKVNTEDAASEIVQKTEAETVEVPVINHSTPEEVFNDSRDTAIVLLKKMLDQYDFKETLANTISYGNFDEVEAHYFAPFFTINLSTDENYQNLVNILLSAEWPDQYVALHLVHVSVIYYQSYIESSLTHDDLITKGNLVKIWDEFCSKYTHYLGLCQTGVIEIHELQSVELKKVHEMTQQHMELIHKCESVSFADKGGG